MLAKNVLVTCTMSRTPVYEQRIILFGILISAIYCKRIKKVIVKFLKERTEKRKIWMYQIIYG